MHFIRYHSPANTMSRAPISMGIFIPIGTRIVKGAPTGNILLICSAGVCETPSIPHHTDIRPYAFSEKCPFHRTSGAIRTDAEFLRSLFRIQGNSAGIRAHFCINPILLTEPIFWIYMIIVLVTLAVSEPSILRSEHYPKTDWVAPVYPPFPPS